MERRVCSNQRRNFTRASQFGLVPLKQISTLRPQWPWCPVCTALIDFAVFSSASSLSTRLWTPASFVEKKCVFLWHIGNIKWDDAYITSGWFKSSLAWNARASYNDSLTVIYRWLTRRLNQTHPQHPRGRDVGSEEEEKGAGSELRQ